MSERASWKGPKVAVVGVGMWGKNHARNYAEIGALAAIVDRDPEAAQRLAAAHGVPVASFDQVLADLAIAAVALALPPSQNLPLGRRALEAGKHLFVEKPLAMTSEEGAELCRLADALDRRLMVGHILQYHPAFLALLDLAKAGRLGRLQALRSTRLDLGRIRREEDALWALATHDVSMILALVGREPDSVRAFGGYHTHPEIADTTVVDLRFPDSVRAEIGVSWLHPVKEQRLVVVGSDAMAVFDDREPWATKLALYPHRVRTDGVVPTTERAEPEPVSLAPAEPLREECLHFLACVASGARPRTDGWEGLRVLSVLERASATLTGA